MIIVIVLSLIRIGAKGIVAAAATTIRKTQDDHKQLRAAQILLICRIPNKGPCLKLHQKKGKKGRGPN